MVVYLFLKYRLPSVSMGLFTLLGTRISFVSSMQVNLFLKFNNASTEMFAETLVL